VADMKTQSQLQPTSDAASKQTAVTGGATGLSQLRPMRFNRLVRRAKRPMFDRFSIVNTSLLIASSTGSLSRCVYTQQKYITQQKTSVYKSDFFTKFTTFIHNVDKHSAPEMV